MFVEFQRKLSNYWRFFISIFVLFFCNLPGSLITGLKGFQVNIRSIDEAIVIGAALSLSSSAFVLQVHNFGYQD